MYNSDKDSNKCTTGALTISWSTSKIKSFGWRIFHLAVCSRTTVWQKKVEEKTSTSISLFWHHWSFHFFLLNWDWRVANYILWILKVFSFCMGWSTTLLQAVYPKVDHKRDVNQEVLPPLIELCFSEASHLIQSEDKPGYYSNEKSLRSKWKATWVMMWVKIPRVLYPTCTT